MSERAVSLQVNLDPEAAVCEKKGTIGRHVGSHEVQRLHLGEISPLSLIIML
jgi:hypothetical protein